VVIFVLSGTIFSMIVDNRMENAIKASFYVKMKFRGVIARQN